MKGTVDIGMWYCGDNECDCSRPEIAVREYDDSGTSFPAVRLIAEGPFLSRGYGHPGKEAVEDQKQWLKDAIKWYGLDAERRGREGK